MVLGKLPVPGRPTILITVGQRPIALASSKEKGKDHQKDNQINVRKLIT